MGIDRHHIGEANAIQLYDYSWLPGKLQGLSRGKQSAV